MTRISDSQAGHFDNYTTAYARYSVNFFNKVLAADPAVRFEPEAIDYKHLHNGECWCGQEDVMDWKAEQDRSEEGYDAMYEDGGDV